MTFNTRAYMERFSFPQCRAERFQVLSIIGMNDCRKTNGAWADLIPVRDDTPSDAFDIGTADPDEGDGTTARRCGDRGDCVIAVEKQRCGHHTLSTKLERFTRLEDTHVLAVKVVG